MLPVKNSLMLASEEIHTLSLIDLPHHMEPMIYIIHPFRLNWKLALASYNIIPGVPKFLPPSRVNFITVTKDVG